MILPYLWALQWHHNDPDGVSNHEPHGCLLNRSFRRRSKKTSKLRVTGLCAGNSPGPVNSPHKGPVTRKMFPFDDVIMGITSLTLGQWYHYHNSCESILMNCVNEKHNTKSYSTTTQNTSNPCEFFMEYTLCTVWSDYLDIFISKMNGRTQLIKLKLKEIEIRKCIENNYNILHSSNDWNRIWKVFISMIIITLREVIHDVIHHNHSS